MKMDAPPMKLVPEAIFEQHIIVLGKTRSGKSSVMRLLVEHLLDEGKPVTIVDPKGDWWGLKSSADGKKAGYPIVIFGGQHGDVPLNSRSGAQVAELTATENRPCIIDLGGWMPGERTQFWIDFASRFFILSRGRRWLVIDEVHNFCPKGKIMDPNAGKMLHWSNRLASEGLGKGIALIAASQRPQKVHNDFLTSCETLIAMRVIHAADRGAIEDWIDGCGDSEKGPEVVNTLASMKRGEAWAWSPEAEFGPKRIQFPMFSTYDSFRPQAANVPMKLKGWADVDLGEVTKRLESVVREAEANDPAKLRARIVELQKELRKASSYKSPSNEGAKQEDTTKAVQRALASAQRQFDTQGAAQSKEIREAYRTLMLLADAAQQRAAALEKHLARPCVVKIPGGEIQRKEVPPPTLNLAHPRRETTPMQPNGDGELKGPHRRILKAMAQIASLRGENSAQSPEMIAAWAGYRHGGGGFNNPMGNLRSWGYVQGCRLTDTGVVAAGDQNPPSNDEIKAIIADILDGPERKILATLMAHGRDVIPKEQLAEESGYQYGSGGFNNPMGSLRTAGFIDYPERNAAQAAEWLFPEGVL